MFLRGWHEQGHELSCRSSVGQLQLQHVLVGGYLVQLLPELT